MGAVIKFGDIKGLTDEGLLLVVSGEEFFLARDEMEPALRQTVR